MNLIVAADAAWGIGKDGEQMVYIAPDLKRYLILNCVPQISIARLRLVKPILISMTQPVLKRSSFQSRQGLLPIRYCN